MPANKAPIKALMIVIPLCVSLACRAATRMVIPDTPTPTPSVTPTLTATVPPTFTLVPTFEAACPALLEEIVDTAQASAALTIDESDQDFDEAESVTLISYEVSDDKISGPHNLPVPEELKDERDDRATHKSIWNYFVSIIPLEERSLLSEFLIFTDGKGNHLAAVGQSFSDPDKWTLHIDIEDAENYYDLTYILIHEHGHLLTLNPEQVPPSEAVFKFPDSKMIYKQEVRDCAQYFTGEGCSTPKSYVNQFFQRFWTDLYPEWEPIDLEEEEDIRLGLLEDFYEMYADQFLTDYAPTSPLEDIAESWSFFVLSPKPESDSIAREKILFFYEYPELVELRTQILKRVCAEFPQ